jgi:hypothetical protein
MRSSNKRPEESQSVPPWTPSSVCAPTDGWTRRRRVAPQWGPSMPTVRQSCTQVSIGDGSFPYSSDVSWPAVASPSIRMAPRQAVATMSFLERTTMSSGLRSPMRCTYQRPTVVKGVKLVRDQNPYPFSSVLIESPPSNLFPD